MPDFLEKLPPALFVAWFAACAAWEGLSRSRAPAGGARRRARNLLLTVVNFGLGGLTGAALLAAARWAENARWGLAALSPLAAQAALGVLVLDASDYWRHRVSHQVPGLWRLHRLHHTDPRIDVTTALRSHPLEQLLRPAFLVAPVLAFGLPRLAVQIYPLLSISVLVFQHAGAELPARVDRAIAWLVSTPATHLVHHSRDRRETDSNYATGLTLWDRLFGSFTPAPLRGDIGLDGFDAPADQSLRGMLSNPWRGARA